MTRACEHVMGIEGPYGKGRRVSGCVMGESGDARERCGGGLSVFLEEISKLMDGDEKAGRRMGGFGE